MMSNDNEEPTSSSDYMGIDMDQRPSSPPTSPLTSPEPPRWRFVNAAKKAAGYGSEWKVQSAGGADGTASAADDGKAILDAARNARNAWKVRESVNGSKLTTDETKVDLSSGWSGGVSSGVLRVVSKDEQDVNGDDDEQPQLELLQPAGATDESSFDTAIDDASAQQQQHSEAKLDEMFDTANDEAVVSTEGGWRGVVTETYKSFDELQTREGERLEEPPLALPDEVRGMMHTLGQMLYYGNNNNSDDDDDEEVGEATARPAVDAEETQMETVGDESVAEEQENETTEEAKEAPAQDDAAEAETKATDDEQDELDQVEKQELADVDLATEETPSVEHSASNDDQPLAKEDKAATNEQQPASRRKRWIVFILVLAVIAIAAVVLGVIFSGNKSTDDGTCLVDGEECVPNNCQSWTCGDTDCCCCGGLTCLADTRAGFGRPVCG